MARNDKGEAGARTGRRRAPLGEERQRDAERSRQRLLEAALEEFGRKGSAGARVSEIAAKAGLNKQLITYYFGGKDGLYRAVHELWLQREAEFLDRELRLDELIAKYFCASQADPRLGRLLIWDGLAEAASSRQSPDAVTATEDLSDLRRRQEQGELAADLDPAMVQLALMGIVLAPIAMPQIVRRVTGMNPDTPEFEQRYTEQIKRMIRHLAGNAEPAKREN